MKYITLNKFYSLLKEDPVKNLIVLIGPPLSGKSTFTNTIPVDIEISSSDNLVMELGSTDNYNENYKEVSQKEVRKILNQRNQEYCVSDKNVVIDMTNMNSKRRRKTNVTYSKHRKFAILFEFPPIDEYRYRNNKRYKENSKFISESLFNDFIDSFQPIKEEENFDYLIELSKEKGFKKAP